MTRRQRLAARVWNRGNARRLLSMGLLLLAVSSFRSAIADWNDVPTGSMLPTIQIGDRILVNKLAYDLKIPFTQKRLATWGDPERGDIVVCWSPADGARLVKRVIGVPGDVLALRDNRLIINGEPVAYEATDPDYALEGVRYFTEDLPGAEHVVALAPRAGRAANFGPVSVPEGRFFVMGDNRDNSADSRYFGFIDRSAICGRTRALAWSLDFDGNYLPRWERFFFRLV